MRFGPLVGYKLQYLYNNIKEIEVYGSLENNVCATNAKKTIQYIKNKYSSPLIIAIDSAISSRENIGNIITKKRWNVFRKSVK